MPRSGAEARERLEGAALELYSERGYEQTTIAEIAARAGVTQRTFFRHFGDKREVLFNVELRQQQALATALADVPGTVPPLTAVLRAFRSMAPDLEKNRPLVEARHRVIAATPALRERELAKEAALSVVVAGALRARGLPDWDATLLAQVSTAALGHAIHTWAASADGGIDALITRAFTGLRDFSDIEIAPGPGSPGANSSPGRH
jgi:AcrR family transcriptional regulator